MNKTRKTQEILIYALVAVGVLVAPSRDAKADFTFGVVENLGPTINTSLNEHDPGLSQDGLSLCFWRYQPDYSGLGEGFVARRATRSDIWGDPVSFGLLTDTASGWPADAKALSEAIGGAVRGWGPADDIELYVYSDSLGGYGGYDIYVLKRETVDSEWDPPLNLGPAVNTTKNDIAGFISPDGLTFYFSSFDRPGGYGRSDLYVTTRPTRSEEWRVATNLGPKVNGVSYDIEPIMSPDGLLLFFTSARPGGLGGEDIWMTRRASLSDPWEQAENLGPTVNSSGDECSSHLSADGSALYFCSNRSGGEGGLDLWRAPIVPVVDFNSDGQVNHLDVGLLMLHWGTDNSLYDIGPTPLGDGIVESKDLMVLAEHGAFLAGDVNYDGVVDFFDLAELAKNWLQDNNP
jgi:hypothetical protein